RANRRKNSTFPINQRAVAIKGDNSKIGSHNDLLFVVDILAFIHKYVNMRTTIELPDGLYRTLKARAGLSGTTVREVIHRLIEKGLRAPAESPPSVAKHAPPPVIIAPRGLPIPALSREELRRIEEE